MSREITYDTVVPLLLDALPGFRPTHEEHLADFGELLPHLLFGDLTRFVLAARAASDHTTVTQALNFLETASLSADQKVRDLVADSFVENVGPWDEAQQGFIRTWPHNLRAEAERQGGSR
jgi:hypothetical protein